MLINWLIEKAISVVHIIYKKKIIEYEMDVLCGVLCVCTFTQSSKTARHESNAMFLKINFKLKLGLNKKKRLFQLSLSFLRCCKQLFDALHCDNSYYSFHTVIIRWYRRTYISQSCLRKIFGSTKYDNINKSINNNSKHNQIEIWLLHHVGQIITIGQNMDELRHSIILYFVCICMDMCNVYLRKGTFRKQKFHCNQY